jgi:hypothetical protein
MKQIKKKWIFLATTVAVSCLILAVAMRTYGITGMFDKAFSKSLTSGEQYEKNITVRKFFNATVRFKKTVNSTTYLAFNDSDAEIALKDAADNEIASLTGIENGKAYATIDKRDLDLLAAVSVQGAEGYEDVSEQVPIISYSGTTAYITILLTTRTLPASIYGLVKDELTDQAVSGIELYAFVEAADPITTQPTVWNATDAAGSYLLTFNNSQLGSYDIYVKDYSVS